MTSLPFQKPKIRLHGDKEEAQRYVGGATALLHQVEMIMARSGVPVFSSTKTLNDGTVIYAGVFGKERIIQVWSASFYSGEEEDEEDKRKVYENALSWLPVGFVVTPDNANGPIPQTFITPLERNNYPKDVYQFNGGSGGLKYAPIFHDGKEIVGMSAGNLQEDPRFSPRLFSDEPDEEWYALPTEAIPLEEVYSGDVLTCAAEVLSRVTNPSIVPPIRGVYTGPFRNAKTISNLEDFILRSGLPTTFLYTSETEDPVQAATAFAATLNNELNDLTSSRTGVRWMIDVGKNGGVYYLTVSRTEAIHTVSSGVTTTAYGTTTALLTRITPHAIRSFYTASTTSSSDSVVVRGRRIFLNYYASLQYSVLGAALIGDGVLGLVVYQKDGNATRLHYDTWSTDDITTLLSRTTYPLPSNAGGISSIVFSESGSKCAMLLWIREQHPNDYLDKNTAIFSSRKMVAKPSFGTRVRVLQINQGAWSAGSLQGVMAQVEASTESRTLTQDEVESWIGIDGMGDHPEDVALREEGYYSGNSWTLRTSRYHYLCQGSVPQALQFNEENLITADLELDIEIEQECSVVVWKDVASDTGLDPDKRQSSIDYEIIDPSTGNPIAASFVFDNYQDAPSKTPIRKFRNIKTLKTPSYNHVCTKAAFVDDEDGADELEPDCHQDIFHAFNLLDSSKNHFVRMYPALDENTAPLSIQWYINNEPSGQPIPNANAGLGGYATPRMFMAAGSLLSPNTFVATAREDGQLTTNNFFIIGGSIIDEDDAWFPSTHNVYPVGLVLATDHWADIAPDTNASIRLTGRFNDDPSRFLYESAQSPSGARFSNSNQSVNYTVQGETLVALAHPKIISGPPPNEWYRNWSTLPIQELLGVAEDEKLVPAAVMGD